MKAKPVTNLMKSILNTYKVKSLVKNLELAATHN